MRYSLILPVSSTGSRALVRLHLQRLMFGLTRHFPRAEQGVAIVAGRAFSRVLGLDVLLPWSLLGHDGGP